MQVLTVGCSEGSDATAWHTVIKRPRIQNFLSGNPTYEAIECDVAPKQGRSGGGLLHDRRLRRGRLQLRRAAGQSRPLRHAAVDLQPARPQQPDGTLRTGHDAARATLLADRRPASQPRRNAPGLGRPLPVAGQRRACSKPLSL